MKRRVYYQPLKASIPLQVKNSYYIGRHHAGRDRAWLAIQACLDQLYVISVGFNELQVAVTLGDNDFEDNLQIACAMTAQLDIIVTRDPSGFAASNVPVLTPQQILATLSLDS